MTDGQERRSRAVPRASARTAGAHRGCGPALATAAWPLLAPFLTDPAALDGPASLADLVAAGCAAVALVAWTWLALGVGACWHSARQRRSHRAGLGAAAGARPRRRGARGRPARARRRGCHHDRPAARDCRCLIAPSAPPPHGLPPRPDRTPPSPSWSATACGTWRRRTCPGRPLPERSTGPGVRSTAPTAPASVPIPTCSAPAPASR